MVLDRTIALATRYWLKFGSAVRFEAVRWPLAAPTADFYMATELQWYRRVETSCIAYIESRDS